MAHISFHNWSAEKISQRVLYLLIGLVVVVFGLFYLIGYNLPYLFNPEFNAPLFTDAVLVLIFVLLLATLVLTVVSVVSNIRKEGRAEAHNNNIPVRLIAYCIAGVTALSLLLTFLLGSTHPVPINGKQYTDTLWLRASDMFINTTLLLLVIALGAVIFGATRYYRKRG